MAYQRVPETAEISVHYTLDTANMVNTYHGRFPGGYALADLQALATAIDFTPAKAMLNNQSKDIVYSQTVVRGLDSEFDSVVSANAQTGPGLVVSRAMPANVTLAVQRNSGLTGRSSRGRVYVVGIPVIYQEGDPLDQNEIQATYATTYQNLVEGFRLTINAVAGWTAVIVSRYHDGSKRTEAVTFPWVNTVVKDRRFDTLRARIRL